MDIFSAIKEGNVARVRELIDEDHKNLFLQNHGFTTPLEQAARKRNLEITRILLEKGANPNFHLDYDSPLNIASQNGSLEIVRALLTYGANPNEMLYDYRTPLLTAYHSRNLEIMRVLLQNGADINRRFEFGMTLLHRAVRNNDLEIVNFLLLNHANPNILNEDHENALDMATDDAIRNLLLPLMQHQQPIGSQILPPLAIRLTPEQLENYNEGKCSICYEKYKEKEITLINDCKHVFHTDCITAVINNSDRRKCPLCNASIVNIQPLILDPSSPNQQQIYLSGGGMNYFEKYQKYKNKYLELKKNMLI
jgi:hypothetical protein